MSQKTRLLNENALNLSPINTSSIQEEIKRGFISPSDAGNLGNKPTTQQIQTVVVDNEKTKYFIDNICENIIENAPRLNPKKETGVVLQGVAEVTTQAANVSNMLRTGAAGLTIVGISGVSIIGWPAVLGFAASAVILNAISSKLALNRELQELIIMVKGQLERIFNIYSTIEEIAQENGLQLNTEMIRRYTGLILSNIIICSGNNAYLTIINHLDKGLISTVASPTTDIALPGKAASVVSTFLNKWWTTKKASISSKNLQEEGHNKELTAFKTSIDPNQRNQIINRMFSLYAQYGNITESIRGITRDMLMLEVYFSILEGEFELLLKAKKEKENAQLLQTINSAKSFEDIKGAMITMLQPAKWTNTESFQRFYSQLPKSNLNFNLAQKIESATDINQEVKNNILKDVFKNVISEDPQPVTVVSGTAKSSSVPPVTGSLTNQQRWNTFGGSRKRKIVRKTYRKH
jgi:hypothetical protein